MKLIFVFILSVPLLISGCEDVSPKSATPLEAMVNNLISPVAFPIISNLQGGGVTFGGYEVILRFTASQSIKELMIDLGYEPKPCGTLFDSSPDFQFIAKGSTTFVEFDPPWNTNVVVNPECLSWSGANKWTHLGYGKILIDNSNNEVYFQGNGA